MKWNKHLDILVRLVPLCRTPPLGNSGTGLSLLETENLLQILESRDKSKKGLLHCPPYIRLFYLATSTGTCSFLLVIIRESVCVQSQFVYVSVDWGLLVPLPCVVVLLSIKQPLRIWVCKSIPIACNAKS